MVAARGYDRGMRAHPPHKFGAWHAGRWGDFPDDWDRQRRFRASTKARLLIPVVISFLVQVPAALFWAAYLRFTPQSLILLGIALVGPLVLLAARRLPGPTVVAMTVLACADFLLSGSMFGPPYIALAFAIGGAIVRGARVWAWLSVGVGWLLTLVVGIVFRYDWEPGRVAATTLGVLIVFGIAESIRTQREQYAEYRRGVAQRKQSEVQAERVRIARELHDVLAHSLSQINVQAGVGLHLMDKQPEKAKEALASIKDTSKTALDEVRSVLGILRAEGSDPNAPLVPEPDLSRLPGLVASVTSQGVEVTLHNELDDVPKAVQLAIYRIVQESLTNVVRHAGATAAAVDLQMEGDRYLVTVGDNGSGYNGGETEGRGMLGMHERAELLGGTLETGRSPLGGLQILVTIPVKEHIE